MGIGIKAVISMASLPLESLLLLLLMMMFMLSALLILFLPLLTWWMKTLILVLTLLGFAVADFAQIAQRKHGRVD